MGKCFCALFKKDCRMLASGKFFLMTIGFLSLYTAYVNFGYLRFMQMEPYNVYLYDPAGTQTEKSSRIQTVPSMEAIDTALLSDANGVGLDASAGDVRVVLYKGAEHVDRHRADYALSLLHPSDGHSPKILGTHTPEQKARKEITCELLFFELAAVGFLGIAAVLFKEKGMGVIRVHAILPLQKDLFLLSKLAVFLLSDLGFAVLLTLLNVGLASGAAVLPAVLPPNGHPLADDGPGGAALRPAAERFPSVYIGLSGDCCFCRDPCIFIGQYVGQVWLDQLSSILSRLYGDEKRLLRNGHFANLLYRFSSRNRVVVPDGTACVPPGNRKGGIRCERLTIPDKKRPAG